MSASHVVRTFSNISRVPSHHQPPPPPPPPPQSHQPQAQTMSHSSEYRQQNRLTLASSPLSPQSPLHFSNGAPHGTASTYESAQLIANEAQIDPSLLAHENPGNCCDTVSPLPLDQYKLNVDRNPLVVRRKPQEKVRYSQQISVRYLKPPTPPKCGDIVICELPSRQVAPAPPLVVRQAPPKPSTPPPLILRLASIFRFYLSRRTNFYIFKNLFRKLS